MKGTLIVVASLLLLAFALAAGRPPSEYLSSGDKKDEDLLLKGAVRLEVGQTGESPGRDAWVIQPSGQWTQTKRGRKEPLAKGKLNERQMRAIAAHFSAMRFNTLPNRIGLPAEDLVGEEERHFLTLTFGKRRTVLISKHADFSDVMALAADGREAFSKETPKDAGFGKDPVKDAPRDRDTAREPDYEDWSRVIALAAILKEILHSSRTDDPPTAKEGDKKGSFSKDK